MSKIIKQLEWEPVNGNYILRIDENHYISYNPDTSAGHMMGMFDFLMGTRSGEETALVDITNPDHKYRILDGDWRDEYEKLVLKGFEDCVDFFATKRSKYGGAWSTHESDRAHQTPLEENK